VSKLLDGVPIAAEGIEDGVLEVLCILEHGFGQFGKTGDDESRLNGDVAAVGGEVAQAIECGVGFERTTVIGECYERGGVKTDLELVSKRPLDSRVESHPGSLQSDLDVGASASQSNRSHQQWASVVHTVVAPLDQTNPELQGLNPSGVLEL
jgi:hypothetical protein